MVACTMPRVTLSGSRELPPPPPRFSTYPDSRKATGSTSFADIFFQMVPVPARTLVATLSRCWTLHHLPWQLCAMAQRHGLARGSASLTPSLGHGFGLG